MPVRLTVTIPRQAQIGSGRSFGLLNPTGITVYIAVGGGIAAPNAEAVPVPPTSLLVLPVEVDGVKLRDPLGGVPQEGGQPPVEARQEGAAAPGRQPFRLPEARPARIAKLNQWNEALGIYPPRAASKVSVGELAPLAARA